GGRGRNQHGGAVPQKRQRHQVRGTAVRVGRGHPRVGVLLKPAQRVGLALLRGPGRRGHRRSLLGAGRGQPLATATCRVVTLRRGKRWEERSWAHPPPSSRPLVWPPITEGPCRSIPTA